MKRNTHIFFTTFLFCILAACGGRSSIGLGGNSSGQQGGGPPVTYDEAGLPLPPPDSGPPVVFDMTVDPFAKYTCEKDAPYNMCEYTICSFKDVYNSTVEFCTIEPYCSQYKNCILEYVLCFDKACFRLAMDIDAMNQCSENLLNCYAELTP